MAEPGTATVQTLWTEAAVAATSRLTYPEARAALAAALRDGRLSAGDHVDAVAALQRAIAQLTTIDADPAITDHAGDLAQVHGLRGFDAVHLASALALTGRGDQHVIFATWDRRPHAAAADAGLSPAPPTIAPG